MAFNTSSNSPPSLPCAAKKLLMHRGPMLLIDELLERHHNHAVASAVLDKNNICISGNSGNFEVLPEYFIEILAQTVAAASGYDTLATEAPPGTGFLVGVEDFTFTVPLQGSTVLSPELPRPWKQAP